MKHKIEPQRQHSIGLTMSSSTTVVPESVVNSLFAQNRARETLRVCCYGSSASTTPEAYTTAAAEVGYLLARRGHTCVNGAGSFGCMAAMNDGASQGGGHIVGVIHEMWLVDKGDWVGESGRPLRDGGAHDVFAEREMLVASGPDLQERKKLLVKDADALVVLPGGPGTWDELWEMACGRNIGLHNIPICLVNINGYYDPFMQILQRAYDEKLTKLEPDKLIHACKTPREAVEWLEYASAAEDKLPLVDLPTRRKRLRQNSFFPGSALASEDSWLGRSFSQLSEAYVEHEDTIGQVIRSLALVGVGTMLGFLLNERRASNRSS